MTQDRGGGGARLRYDRAIVIALLVAVAGLAWAYTAYQANSMNEMDAAMWREMAMSMNEMPPSWTPLGAFLLFVMWTAMMVAMMVPGVTPMMVAFATINRRRRERALPYVPTAVFLADYLVIWAGFSILATALQWLLQRIGLVTTMMRSASYPMSAVLFLAAGLYQFSPLKRGASPIAARPTDSF
jgi:predicted metal-binding membrane protein